MTDEQQESVPKPTDWQLRSELESELRTKLRIEYETLFGFWKTEELDKVRKEAEQIATDGLQKLFDKWKEEQKPPTDEEIQLLLNQEYATFNLQIEAMNTSGDNGAHRTTETFVIRELPQEAEIKFYRQFKDKVLGKSSALQAFTQANVDMPFESKAKAFLELFDESFDMLADAVVICLNPYADKKEITRQWVQKNISSNRQWNIVDAQIRVNKLKDFFSRLSQSGQSTQTMLGGLNFQQLQQLAR
jgi:hypothetical protein